MSKKELARDIILFILFAFLISSVLGYCEYKTYQSIYGEKK